MIWLDDWFKAEFQYLSDTYGTARAYEVFSAVELGLLIVVLTTFVGVLAIYWDTLIDLWYAKPKLKLKLNSEYKPRRAL